MKGTPDPGVLSKCNLIIEISYVIYYRTLKIDLFTGMIVLIIVQQKDKDVDSGKNELTDYLSVLFTVSVTVLKF